MESAGFIAIQIPWKLFEKGKCSWGLMSPRAESGDSVLSCFARGKHKGSNSKTMAYLCETSTLQFTCKLTQVVVCWISPL